MMMVFPRDRSNLETITLRLTRFSGVFIVFVVLTASLAAADDSKPMQPMPMQSCEKDRVRFCNDKKELPDIGLCLIEHDKDVSNECKQELERFREMRKQATPWGGVASSPFGGPNAMGSPVPFVSYDVRYSAGKSSTSFVENKLNLSAPIYKSGADTVSLSLAGSSFHWSDSLALDSGKEVPADLYRTEVGVQYDKQLPEKKRWGLRGSVGYAGDKPFTNSSDSTYSLGANYGFPGSGKGYWMLTATISNNSPLVNYIPIPGVSYLYKTDTFTGMFGFPASSIQWTPVFPWSFSLAIFGPMVRSEVSYGSIDLVQYFAGFYWTRESYILSTRDNDKDRLTIEEKKAAVGFRIPVWGPMMGEFQLGQAFDRSVYIGNGLFNKDGGSVSIEDDWYLSASIKVKF
jgi:hypothetical protein